MIISKSGSNQSPNRCMSIFCLIPPIPISNNPNTINKQTNINIYINNQYPTHDPTPYPSTSPSNEPSSAPTEAELVGVEIDERNGLFNGWIFIIDLDTDNNIPRFIYISGNIQAILEYTDSWTFTINIDEDTVQYTSNTTSSNRNPPQLQWVVFILNTDSQNRRMLELDDLPERIELYIKGLLTGTPTPAPTKEPTEEREGEPENTDGFGTDTADFWNSGILCCIMAHIQFKPLCNHIFFFMIIYRSIYIYILWSDRICCIITDCNGYMLLL